MKIDDLLEIEKAWVEHEVTVTPEQEKHHSVGTGCSFEDLEEEDSSDEYEELEISDRGTPQATCGLPSLKVRTQSKNEPEWLA